MRIAFLIGVGLVAAALLAAAAEMMAGAMPGVTGWPLSARTILEVHWPHWLAALLGMAESLHPGLRAALAEGALRLPGWLLLGAPGAFLLWWGHPRRGETDPVEARAEEESLFLFDTLARRADEEGYGGGDDMAPVPTTPTPVAEEPPAVGAMVPEEIVPYKNDPERKP